MKASIAILFSITLLIFNSCNPLKEPEHPIKFTQKASSPIARASASSFVIDHKAYILLGRDAKNGGYLNDFWEYDSKTDIWKSLGKLPFKGRVKAIAQVVDNKAYVGLGFNGRVYVDSCYLRDFWVYDYTDSTWTRKADYPSSSSDAVISFVYDKYIYACFGFYNHFSSDVYRYDTEYDKWEQCQDANFLLGAGGAGCTNGKRYFAGFGFRIHTSDQWLEFLPETQTWKKRQAIPKKGRLFSSALSVNEKIYVLGGRFFGGTETTEHFYDEVLEYNIENDTWILQGYLPNGGRENMITFSINGKGYFGLGENQQGKVLNDLFSWE